MSLLTHAEIRRSITVANAFIEKSIGAKYAVMAPVIIALSCFFKLEVHDHVRFKKSIVGWKRRTLPAALPFIHRDKCTPIPALLLLLSYQSFGL